MADPRREIPAVDRLLASEAFRRLLAEAPRTRVLDALHRVQERLRARLGGHARAPAGIDDPGWYAAETARELAGARRRSLIPVINATGVVLHTNLGRAPLPEAAVDAIVRIARGYSNLEYDLEDGVRGSRYDHCAGLLERLTGAEAALVVNNNAAALVLALNTLAEGREGVISRGELVEIGGSFRVPEVMAKSGVRMREVGSTNRTHLVDYEQAIGPSTGVLLKVHRSNFRVSGYTAEASIAELAELSRATDVPLVDDLGSGLVVRSEVLGLPPEPTAREALDAGASVVTMSGDKLLGGPQAGILLGRRSLIDAMRRNPLCRALRVDKLTLAALQATLRLYLEENLDGVPAVQMLTAPEDALESRARALADRLATLGMDVDLVRSESAVGGGAFPETPLPTWHVRIAGRATALEQRLRHGEPPVIVRVIDDRVALDPRTVLPGEEDALVEAIARAAAS